VFDLVDKAAATLGPLSQPFTTYLTSAQIFINQLFILLFM